MQTNVMIIIVVLILIAICTYYLVFNKNKKKVKDHIKEGNIKEAINVADDNLEVFDAYLNSENP